MKTQRTLLHNANETLAGPEAVSARKPVSILLLSLVGAASLALPVFGAQSQAIKTTLYSFTGAGDGLWPMAGLVQGSDGAFYGTTSDGGASPSLGTVFKISTAGVLTTLYSFGHGDGSQPQTALVQGSDGYLYGTTSSSTLFKISTNGGILTTLHAFNGSDGGSPGAALVQGSDGVFYGTTQNGGANGVGTVFKISPDGALTSLYSFTPAPRNYGYNPGAALVQGSDGLFYGTTQNGGTNNGGTVFRISTNGVLTCWYSFPGFPGSAGGCPNGLVQASDGFWYGTTQHGHTNNWGIVFRISTNGTLTTLYPFSGGRDGAQSVSALVQGSDGYLYGTTAYGGAQAGFNGFGTVFRVSTNGALTTLYSFAGGQDGV